MHPNLPSLTAAVVAAAREVASWSAQGDAGDTVSAHFLPRAVAVGLRGLRPVAPALRWLTLGVVEHVAWRTAMLDRAVAQAAAAGVKQLVILGAGLDARAWRLDVLRDTTVFEVDHPATQAYKRQRVLHLPRCAADVRLVSVDFHHQQLDAELQAAGHDVTQPTLWLWEGVTMYLTPEATAATLACIAVRSAAGSMLAVSYVTPEIVQLPAAAATLIRLGFHAIREPLAGALTVPEAAALLSRHGFCVAQDAGSVSRLFACEHVAVSAPRA